MEEVVRGLQAVALAQAAENIAHESLLTALIASHPDPGFLLAVFESSMNHQLTRFQDFGFDRGFSAASTGEQLAMLQKQKDRWRDAIEQVVRRTGPG